MKYMFLILALLSISSVFAYQTYNNNLGTAQNNQSGYLHLLPRAVTHVKPDPNGGYYWIEPSNPYSNNILDRLPQGHRIKPDGNGGFYCQ